MKYKPKWMARDKELGQWAKRQGVFFQAGRTCQVLLLDLGEPFGVMLQRPYRINKEDGLIFGTFLLNRRQIEQARRNVPKPVWLVGTYVRSVNAFVCEVPPEAVTYAIAEPVVSYLEYEKRKELEQALGKELVPNGA